MEERADIAAIRRASPLSDVSSSIALVMSAASNAYVGSRRPKPSSSTRCALACWSQNKGSTIIGLPWWKHSVVVLLPPWVITMSTRGKIAGWGTIMHSVRIGARYVIDQVDDRHPYLEALAGFLAFGDTTTVAAGGGSATLGAGAEVELTDSLVLNVDAELWTLATGFFATRDGVRRSDGFGPNLALQISVGLEVLLGAFWIVAAHRARSRATFDARPRPIDRDPAGHRLARWGTEFRSLRCDQIHRKKCYISILGIAVTKRRF